MASRSGPSAKLIPFPLPFLLRRSGNAPARGPAAILFFTGIRYERAADEPAAQDDPDRPLDPLGGASVLQQSCPPARTRRSRRRA
jgi:hypothetical protein